MGKFFAYVVLLLLTIPIALLRGLVLSDLVDWYTPYNIGVVQAIGISLIFTLLSFGLARTKHDDDDLTNSLTMLILTVFGTLTVWLFGFLWSFFL